MPVCVCVCIHQSKKKELELEKEGGERTKTEKRNKQTKKSNCEIGEDKSNLLCDVWKGQREGKGGSHDDIGYSFMHLLAPCHLVC